LGVYKGVRVMIETQFSRGYESLSHLLIDDGDDSKRKRLEILSSKYKSCVILHS